MAQVEGRKVLVCITGGIAAYKVVQVARSLAQMGIDVRVVMTASAERFVGAQTFAAVTGNPVATAIFGAEADAPHVELARDADLAVVAPATANALAKMALGFADDLFSAVMLTARCPVVAAPAMHAEMWEHPATAAHVRTLEARGVTMVGPDSGALSSGDFGPGRMAEPDAIVEAAVLALGRSRALAGRAVLVTAGGTQEPIDPVRFIGNRSSGRMGVALAAEAARRGAEVTLIAANVSYKAPGVRVVGVQTAAELDSAARAEFPGADVLLMAAAVADFRPVRAQDIKIKKSGRDQLALALEPTTDVLRALSEARHPGQTLVGFAAEHGESGLVHARAKLESKGLDAVVLNDISRSDIGFDTEDNEVTIVTAAGEQPVPLGPKTAVAGAILDSVGALRAERAGHG